MEPFTKNINGIEFAFQGFSEGADEVCRVSVDGRSFRMTVGDDGEWEIWEQVPSWVKKLEKDLANTINEAYC